MEDNLNGIRRLSLNVDSEEGFKAKPVHIYDVCLDEKEYKKMLSDEKKIPLNWFKTSLAICAILIPIGL